MSILQHDRDDEVVIIDKPNDWHRSPRRPVSQAAADHELQDEVMQAATQSTVLELLSNPAVHPASLSRFLTAFPVPEPEAMAQKQRMLLAKQCWEHLLDSTDAADSESIPYDKMDILRRTKLYCPTELFRQYCHLEQVQLLVDALGSQVEAGTFLYQLHRSLSADAQHSFCSKGRKSQELHKKLEGADLLMVVHTLGAGNVFSIDVRQLQLLKLVHLARHGPVAELESVMRMPDNRQEGSSATAEPMRDLVNSSHHGFPILFQPLIECHAGWLDRLSVLLRAGANAAAAVYSPWNCSALHMIFYRKSRKLSENAQVQAVRLLLQHGAKAVLNLADRGTATNRESSSAPTQRTALLQAASAGRLQACRALLAAGADADVVDSCDQSMLEYLFYLKHSSSAAHQRATTGYTCMQLYGLVSEFKLHALVTDELEQDCRSCGRCRFLLASCSNRHDQDAEESDHDCTSPPQEDISSDADENDGKQASFVCNP